ncbi:hypothetical protein [Roseisalinus antarcticus]|uniref:Formate hydrogenlyase n=1 Tax=Roseisalinus antarcticus TaxID=254357 RepID=A0A1Y5RM22_9RHOB|nr:hypothetical protein [Roseisalinus antarcticus]SLN19551.1 hypothetical protein ROA7023_00462 [Roseisalinus antarcticus]
MSFLEPDPYILAFIAVKQGIFLLALLPLALVRALAARRSARWAALAALALCAFGLAARYLPEVLGIYEGLFVRISGIWRGLWGGLAMNFAASAALLASALLPGRRWWGLDLAHVVLLAGLLGLWGYSIWG